MEKNTRRDGKPLKATEIGDGKRAYSLKPQQEEFIQYYLESFSERKAAKLAGYKDYHGHELMKNPLVRDKINMCITALFQKYGVDKDSILTELQTIAFEKDPMTKGIKYSDKIMALKLLGTQLGLFKEKEESKSIQPPAVTIIVDKEVKIPEVIIDDDKPNQYIGNLIQ